MKVEIKTKYQPGDIVWVVGRNIDDEKKRAVRAIVRQTYLSKHSPVHRWSIEHLIQLYDGNGVCLGFNYDIESDKDLYPIYFRKEFEVYMFESEIDVNTLLTEEIF